MINSVTRFSQLTHNVFRNFARLPFLIFWLSLVSLLSFYVIRPIRDHDFWWHLKSGDLMVQQHGLLKFDPFNHTGDGVVGGFQAVLLYGYWVWETVASVLYNSFGFNGIYLLKFATAALLAWAVLFEMSRQQLSQFTRVVLTGLGTIVIVNVYSLERPQLFSIIFTTVLLGMVSRIRQGYLPSTLLFPLMVLWANIHRGFVVGDIILGLTALGFMIQYRKERRRLFIYLVWAFTGILISFINPNGWITFTELYNFMQNSIGPSNVNEYRSTLQLFLLQSKMTAGCLWVLAAVHLTALILVSRRFWPEIFASLFIIYFGLFYIRNTGFIAVSLLPMTGWYVEQAYVRFNKKIPVYIQSFTSTLLVIVIVWLTLGEWDWMKVSSGPVFSNFPVKMAGFLKKSGLKGNLFNEYDDGGYLNWALYPQWKTFIDGRELDTRVSRQYLKISDGSEENTGGKPYYEVMLDNYKIDVVALNIGYSDGRLQPLLKLLLNRPQWIPVYLDNQSFVLVRNTLQNSSSIQRYGMDKAAFVDLLTRIVAVYANKSPDSTYLSVLYADVLIYDGRLEAAQSVLRNVDMADLNSEMMRHLKKSIRS